MGQVFRVLRNACSETSANRYRTDTKRAQPMPCTEVLAPSDRTQLWLTAPWRVLLWSELSDRLYRRHLTGEDLFHALDGDCDGFVSVDDVCAMLSGSARIGGGGGPGHRKRNGKVSARSVIAPERSASSTASSAASSTQGSRQASLMVAPLDVASDVCVRLRRNECFDLLGGNDYVDRQEWLALLSTHANDQQEAEAGDHLPGLPMVVLGPSSSLDDLVHTIQYRYDELQAAGVETAHHLYALMADSVHGRTGTNREGEAQGLAHVMVLLAKGGAKGG